MLVNSFAFGSPSNLLLTFSGANNSNVFVDSSSSNHTITTVGTPIQFDGKGVFDGNGYIYTDTLPKFLGKDFVITGKFKITSWPSGFQAPAIFGYNDLAAQPISLEIAPDSVWFYKKLYVRTTAITQDYLIHQTDITLNVEHTFKIERKDGFIQLYLDDVEANTKTSVGSNQLHDGATRFCIGKGGSTLALYEGKVDELNVALTT